MQMKFEALEYTANGSFIPASYEFDGECEKGWAILRNGGPHLTLGKGYTLLKTRLCGICSTDLARRYLPYPLPQIIGHEVVAERLENGEKVVAEINDTPYYRGDVSGDIFCKSGLYTHSPGRMVLGIDRLPGGFGSYFLAPQRSVIPINGLNEYAAVLTEPFAAALQAVTPSPPPASASVAVLGPRRLGSLVIAALNAYRSHTGGTYGIYALARHQRILEVCRKLGADEAVMLSGNSQEAHPNVYDIVYDTTGSVSGFELALRLAKKEIHVKSTNGRLVCGLSHLTEFVVDELSLLPYNDETLEFKWADEVRRNLSVYIAPGVKKMEVPGKQVFRGEASAAVDFLKGPDFKGLLPRFDIAIASNLKEIDHIIRPGKDNEESLLRPRGAILFTGDAADNPLLDFISRGGRLRSSRCGDFHLALKLLRENPNIAGNLSHYLLSHMFPVQELAEAAAVAGSGRSIKVVVKHA